MRARHIWVSLALVGTLAGCGGGSEGEKPVDPAKVDDAAIFACTDFAKGYKSATTKAARLDLANKVNKWAKTSKTTGIADMGEAMARGANSGDEAWQLGADAFAQTCLDRGWNADNAK